MTFEVKKEAPKAQLVTMGQGNKEIEMAKEEKISYETHPDRYHYPSGATEPVLKPAGGDVISEESAGKQGPVGAKGEPKQSAKPVGKKK